jgi:DNA-binding SARP family transcriptional activator
MQWEVDVNQDAAGVTEIRDRLRSLEREMEHLQSLLAAAAAPQRESQGRAGSGAAASGASATIVAPRYWEVTSLGSFHLRCEGHEVAPCASRRGWSILKYLLASPEYAAQAEVLVDLFWPETEPAAGIHNLHVAVHSLRRALHCYGPGRESALRFCAGRYLLHPALTIERDVDSFRNAFERGRRALSAGQVGTAVRTLEEARSWYGGPYLADNPYEEWAESSRTALQSLKLELLSLLRQAYSDVGDCQKAAECASEILAVDPYREDAVRWLMGYYAACGRVADVERTYRTFADQLHHDLLLVPAAATQDLLRQLVQIG